MEHFSSLAIGRRIHRIKRLIFSYSGWIIFGNIIPQLFKIIHVFIRSQFNRNVAFIDIGKSLAVTEFFQQSFRFCGNNGVFISGIFFGRNQHRAWIIGRIPHGRCSCRRSTLNFIFLICYRNILFPVVFRRNKFCTATSLDVILPGQRRTLSCCIILFILYRSNNRRCFRNRI